MRSLKTTPQEQQTDIAIFGLALGQLARIPRLAKNFLARIERVFDLLSSAHSSEIANINWQLPYEERTIRFPYSNESLCWKKGKPLSVTKDVRWNTLHYDGNSLNLETIIPDYEGISPQINLVWANDWWKEIFPVNGGFVIRTRVFYVGGYWAWYVVFVDENLDNEEVLRTSEITRRSHDLSSDGFYVPTDGLGQLVSCLSRDGDDLYFCQINTNEFGSVEYDQQYQILRFNIQTGTRRIFKELAFPREGNQYHIKNSFLQKNNILFSLFADIRKDIPRYNYWTRGLPRLKYSPDSGTWYRIPDVIWNYRFMPMWFDRDYFYITAQEIHGRSCIARRYKISETEGGEE